MKNNFNRFTLLLLLIIGTFSLNLLISTEAFGAVPNIRVAITIDVPTSSYGGTDAVEARITSQQDYTLTFQDIDIVSKPNPTVIQAKANEEYVFTRVGDTIRIKNSTSTWDSRSNVTINPSAGGFLIVKNVYLSSSTTKYSKVYRGNMEIIKRTTGKVGVINILPIEQYLYGVVPREMPSSWPLEALKAQAVAARTYSMDKMAKRSNTATYPWHVVATTLDQVYGGYGTMNSSTAVPLETANTAVDATRGVVGKYNGQYITALFSSNAGGRTEDNVYVFGSNLPYLKSVDSSWDSVDNRDLNNSTYKWAVTFDKASLESKLKIFGIQEIKINDSTSAGRVQSWLIKTTSSDINITESQLQIRSKLNLKSRFINSIITEMPTRVNTETNYNLGSEVTVLTANGTENITLGSDTAVISGNDDPAIAASSVVGNIEDYRVLGIDIVPAKFTFNGKGYGHGVGLSQWGSNGMAKDGYKYDAILKHYYQGVSLVTDY